jgi:hypothetical protein
VRKASSWMPHSWPGGTDYVMNTGKWSNAKSSRYLRKKLVRDAFQLRLNAYRVLLTRARDAVVVFVPRLPHLDETFDYLIACGFTPLNSNVVA